MIVYVVTRQNPTYGDISVLGVYKCPKKAYEAAKHEWNGEVIPMTLIETEEDEA